MLYKAQQKDPFLYHLLKDYVKVPPEEWPDRPPASECTPEALPKISATRAEDTLYPADILTY